MGRHQWGRRTCRVGDEVHKSLRVGHRGVDDLHALTASSVGKDLEDGSARRQGGDDGSVEVGVSGVGAQLELDLTTMKAEADQRAVCREQAEKRVAMSMRIPASVAVTNAATNPKTLPVASSSAARDCIRVEKPILDRVEKKKKRNMPMKNKAVVTWSASNACNLR